ncbi:MAG: PepSY domain-containing protein [Paracoccaceae bacterium]|nr:PepSY domain-containing protein [Paracoccaceae bacterium]
MTPRTIIGTTLIALSIPAAALALSVGDTLSTNHDEIRAKLEAEGYKILEIETEDGEIEVEYEQDGQVFEMEIDMTSGVIQEVELDDDEDDDDD